jgi:hypothetical protein
MSGTKTGTGITPLHNAKVAPDDRRTKRSGLTTDTPMKTAKRQGGGLDHILSARRARPERSTT